MKKKVFFLIFFCSKYSLFWRPFRCNPVNIIFFSQFFQRFFIHGPKNGENEPQNTLRFVLTNVLARSATGGHFFSIWTHLADRLSLPLSRSIFEIKFGFWKQVQVPKKSSKFDDRFVLTNVLARSATGGECFYYINWRERRMHLFVNNHNNINKNNLVNVHMHW